MPKQNTVSMSEFMQLHKKKKELENELKKADQRNYYYKSQIKKLRENESPEKEHSPRFLLLEREGTSNKYTIRSVD